MNGQNYRCGWVALMGPPNAGKSTLLNGLMGQKVTIVTPKPQTTRNQIVGILTDDDAQAIFMDTPGLSQVRGRLSKTMIQAVWQSLGQADVIMPVLDAHLYIRHPEYLDRDLAPVAEALASDERPMVVVANKVDLFADKSRMLPLLTRLNEMWPRAEIFPVSALNKDGLPELAKLIKKQLPKASPSSPKTRSPPRRCASWPPRSCAKSSSCTCVRKCPTASPWKWKTGTKTSNVSRPSSTPSSMWPVPCTRAWSSAAAARC